MNNYEEEALSTLRGFHNTLYRKRDMQFEELVKDMLHFLCDHLNAYIHAEKPFFKTLKECSDIYRCVNSNEELINPGFARLTSPPVEKTRHLRMSRKGTSYFYGSFEEQTPIVEASSPDAKYSYLAHFRTTRPLVLFDLTGLDHDMSPFGKDSLKNECEAFLVYYARYISRPNNEDSEEYLNTQVITRFVKECVKQHLPNNETESVDGVLYLSSKTQKENVALFYDNSTSAEVLTLVDWRLLTKEQVKLKSIRL